MRSGCENLIECSRMPTVQNNQRQSAAGKLEGLRIPGTHVTRIKVQPCVPGNLKQGAVMKTVTVNGYAALVKHVRRELQELDFIIKRRTAESYWQIGKFIHTHLLASRQRAEHGSAFYERLAGDVERDKSTLLRTVQFYRAYPILAERRELNC